MPRITSSLIAALLVAAVMAAPAGAQSEGALRDRIGSGKQQEQTLANAAARLGQLERKVGREVTVLEGRLSEAQSELDAADARLAATESRLTEARRRVNRLRKRLAEVRAKLSGLLRERYMGGVAGPDDRRAARRRLPAAARDAAVRAARRAVRHAPAGPRALRPQRRRPRAHACSST